MHHSVLVPTHFRPTSHPQRTIRITIVKTNICSYWVRLHQADLKVIRVHKNSHKLITK